MSRRRKLLRLMPNEGAAAVEAGLAFPFLLLFAAGLFEFGGIFYSYELIQTGVRDAARYLARVDDPAAAEAIARNLAVTGSTTGSAPLRVKWWQGNKVSISYRTTPNPIDPDTGLRRYRGNDPLTTIRVSTDVNYPGMGLLNAIGLSSVRITAAHEERHVGE